MADTLDVITEAPGEDGLDGQPDGDRQLTTDSEAIDVGNTNDSDLGADVAGDIGPKHTWKAFLGLAKIRPAGYNASLPAGLSFMLNTLQSQTLQSAVNRILPADDYPCGWDAGVGDFLALLLTREPHFVTAYQRGLDGLEAEAQAAAGMAFTALTSDAQDALLTRVEAGELRTDWHGDPAWFFRLLVEQAMEGFYADPDNGGNKGGIAWEMIGYQVTA